jgi:RecB family exonuclease
MRTSYSAIETYLQCPQRYKYQEIDRIRAPKSREAIFGTLVHATLKFMFERNPLYPTLDEVIAYFRERWPEREVFLAESKNDPMKRPWTGEEEKLFFEEGVRMLKRFYEKNAPWNYLVADLESRFEVALTDETTGETHILAGIIDRIDKLPDGTYEIIDYKTGKKMPSQDALNRDLQLSLYSLGLQKRWPHLKPDDIKMSLYFLKHGEKLTARPAPDATEKTVRHILKTARDIQERMRENKTFEPMPGILCNWCGYRPMCPAWRHLYKNQAPGIANQVEENKAVNEYLALKKSEKKIKDRMEELHAAIEAYMEREGLTRVFGDDGYLSKKTQQRWI